ncbi:DUF805 domain-containing protein [Ramlibacter rhizophilus]|uniref:DUF805 domain-containing protein n=1 Tax=Ramlibacter rhizophilus TaxID=1781167 RepID=A0A4Z0BF75_9BURK|nr:DUF805 domain-containing protein [Ramlibacter rhizophilus]TFY97331.1 DUF805 domain-containing protein [Ramlibacter rhizophilus]
MNFTDAVKTCLRQYATFTGRASRPEFWWFMLFVLLLSMAASLIGPRVNALVTLLLLLPSIAVAARRLHDIDKSGWWQLVSLVPLVGWLVTLYWYVQPSQPSGNRFG